MFHRLVVRALPRASKLFSRPMMTATVSRRVTVPAVGVSMTSGIMNSTRSLTTTAQPDMFCRQCEQTQDHFACTTVGVCGKSPETAAIQDTLMYMLQSVSVWSVAHRQAGEGAYNKELLDKASLYTVKAAFSTLTNVNFSEERIAEYIKEGNEILKSLRDSLPAGATAPSGSVAELDLSGMSMDDMEAFGHEVGVVPRKELMGNEDCFSLNEIGTYGMKGVCAYAAHCVQLGYVDDQIMADIHEVYAKLSSNEADMEGLLANALRVGEINARVLAMLDDAHATKFGAPEPTQVLVSAHAGKCILVSGHDLMDLEKLLEQTEGEGVNVYTHGEMLPAHSYPGLKQKYPHLVGNYGTAWQNQKLEFAGFPGPIIVTTNCVLEPRRVYKDRLYTMNEVGVDGVSHIGEDRDYSKVIEQAKEMKGFPRTAEPPRYVLVGFNHRAVLPLAGQVIEAAQTGVMSRIVLIGGCDGSQWDRNYFTDLAEGLPDDTLILTLGCAKNRIIHSEKLLGSTLANGMPRVLDMGQCNDSYSAIVVANELAKALDCGVNDLPLSLALSHLEQKATAVLLTLLHLGVKNIRLGPSLPAYVSPGVLDVLVQNYNLMPVGNVQEDIQNIMEGK